MSSKETLSFLMPRRIFCPEKLLGQCSPGPFPLPGGVQERTARMSLDTVCPQYPELHQKKGGQQGVGGGLSPLCCAFLRSQLQAGQIALFFLWNLLPGALGCSCPISVFLATTETTRAQFSWFPHRREEKGIRSITSWPTSAISSFPPSCTALSSPRSVFWLL